MVAPCYPDGTWIGPDGKPIPGSILGAYEYREGVYHKDGKFYDFKNGKFEEYTASYTNEDGYRYIGVGEDASFYKDGQAYDFINPFPNCSSMVSPYQIPPD